MSPQQREVWSLVRTARNALQEAIELENDLETDRRDARDGDRLSVGSSGGYTDPLCSKLEAALDSIHEVLA
jgi:hypothetical protein